ncbi:MAG: hypothetical protein O3C19_06120 [Bacteroidetes bacterium]|jgi:hypothetical protein|nr:hypothetical protein [Bacteroidota bacterium]
MLTGKKWVRMDQIIVAAHILFWGKATPTMFLINSEGVIIEKVATVTQLIN